MPTLTLAYATNSNLVRWIVGWERQMLVPEEVEVEGTEYWVVNRSRVNIGG